MLDTPTMCEPRRIAADTHLLSAYLPVPGFGVLPVNAFVIEAAEPVLVDTGLAALREDFVRQLSAAIDPNDLGWIWLTHVDADHVGNLAEVLALAPRSRVVTTFVGMGKMLMLGLPPERMHLLNPGQALDAGDRRLLALVPPTFDAPETTALYDEKAGALYSADCFGALMEAPAETADAIGADALREGGIGWTTADAPWLHDLDPGRLAARLDAVRRLAPAAVLGSHLPPAPGAMTETLLANIAAAADAPAFTGPDQAAIEAMMAAA